MGELVFVVAIAAVAAALGLGLGIVMSRTVLQWIANRAVGPDDDSTSEEADGRTS